MWTRPDAFVLAGAIVIPHLWLNGGADRRAPGGPATWRTFLAECYICRGLPGLGVLRFSHSHNDHGQGRHQRAAAMCLICCSCL